jgi:hypothetical protein
LLGLFFELEDRSDMFSETSVSQEIELFNWNTSSDPKRAKFLDCLMGLIVSKDCK